MFKMFSHTRNRSVVVSGNSTKPSAHLYMYVPSLKATGVLNIREKHFFKAKLFNFRLYISQIKLKITTTTIF